MSIKTVDSQQYVIHTHIEEDSSAQPIKFKDMLVGQVGVMAEGEYKGHLVLRAYRQWVSLNRPSATWSGDGAGRLHRVIPLKPTDAFTIVIK